MFLSNNDQATLSADSISMDRAEGAQSTPSCPLAAPPLNMGARVKELSPPPRMTFTTGPPAQTGRFMNALSKCQVPGQTCLHVIPTALPGAGCRPEPCCTPLPPGLPSGPWISSQGRQDRALEAGFLSAPPSCEPTSPPKTSPAGSHAHTLPWGCRNLEGR